MHCSDINGRSRVCESLWQGLCLVREDTDSWLAEGGIRNFLLLSPFGCHLSRTPGRHTVLIVIGQMPSLEGEGRKLTSSSQCLPQPTSFFLACGFTKLLLQEWILSSSGIAEQRRGLFMRRWRLISQLARREKGTLWDSGVDSPAQFGAVAHCGFMDVRREGG